MPWYVYLLVLAHQHLRGFRSREFPRARELNPPPVLPFGCGRRVDFPGSTSIVKELGVIDERGAGQVPGGKAHAMVSACRFVAPR